MIESIREFLYPLGYLSAIIFALRFMQQWITSELHQKSMVTRSFWQLSLAGNVMFMIHAFLQVQFHVCLIQALNGIISWRNLNLMRSSAEQIRLRTVVLTMVGSTAALALGFVLQGYFLGGGFIEWFRIPIWSGSSAEHVGVMWHIIGTAGLLLFSSRFWVQWWSAEQEHVSTLSLPFWWLSLGGGVLSLIYFIKIEDPVNVIGPAFGMIPYIRNVMLIYKARETSVELP